uniref:Uncharacterized protein n=1 Tax=viral metagenome TaxID=1070528 RepID=A0A6C0DQK4_9ZZZZ
MTAWTNLVKKTYSLGKKKDKNYSLKDAMLAAKKQYKKKKGGEPEDVVEAEAEGGEVEGGEVESPKTEEAGGEAGGEAPVVPETAGGKPKKTMKKGKKARKTAKRSSRK